MTSDVFKKYLDLRRRVPQRDGEEFHDWWRRCWYLNELSASAYGHSTPIARMRRGKWVFIPAQWRGKVPMAHKNRRRNERVMKRSLAERKRARKEPLEDLDIYV